jgi:hypothetical protein
LPTSVRGRRPTPRCGKSSNRIPGLRSRDRRRSGHGSGRLKECRFTARGDIGSRGGRLVEANEESTLERLKALRGDLIDPTVTEHRGRFVKTTGDGLLIEFSSVVDVLRCAVERQAALAKSNDPTPPDQRIEFRVGINVGDIVVEDGDFLGDGVNVAARLEALAKPGGICVSKVVLNQVCNKLDFGFEDLWLPQVKRVRSLASAIDPGRSPEPALPCGSGERDQIRDATALVPIATERMNPATGSAAERCDKCRGLSGIY